MDDVMHVVVVGITAHFLGFLLEELETVPVSGFVRPAGLIEGTTFASQDAFGFRIKPRLIDSGLGHLRRDTVTDDLIKFLLQCISKDIDWCRRIEAGGIVD